MYRIRAALVLFALVVLVAAQPVAVCLGLGASSGLGPERNVIAWFGMRGVASMCYLSIALHGLPSLPLRARAAGQQS